MRNPTIDFASRQAFVHVYLLSVAHAGGVLLQALFASTPRKAAPENLIPESEISKPEQVREMLTLHRMAHRNDSAKPDFAAELHYLHSSD